MTIFGEEYAPIIPTWEKEMWVLDPGPFTDIAFDLGVVNFVFRSKYHERNKQDFRKFIDMYARGRVWRVMWTTPGDFAVMFTSMTGWDHPAAVWKIWRSTTDTFDQMDDWFHNPPPKGTVMGVYGPDSKNDGEPVSVVGGQPHRLLIGNAPKDAEWWERIAGHVQRLQMEDPTKTLHFHGQKSIGRTIGIAAKSFDHPVRIGFINGFPQVLLPNGMLWNMETRPSEYQKQWLRIVGANTARMEKMAKQDLSREVYRVNLLSLRWAFLNWDRAWDFRRASEDDLHVSLADLDWEPESLPIRLRRTKKEDILLDRWQCDTCTLQFKCPYSREGAVCIVPDSEPAELAHLFHTRNANTIIDGLGTVLAAMAHRVNTGLRIENKKREDPEHQDFDQVASPEVTRMLNSLFDRGVVLAKLVDPKLAARMGPKINVGVFNIPGAGIGDGSPPISKAEFTRGIKAELEARGIDFATATTAQIDDVLTELRGGPTAIEASSTEGM